MNQVINQIVMLLQQGIATIFKFFELVWTWSFGQIVAVFQSNPQNLSIWKILVLAIVVIAIIYLLYNAALQLWKAAQDILQAFVALLSVLVTILPYILIAGVVAAAGGWVIQNTKF